MNIFVLDRDPTVAARYHCDKHVVKMTLESCQILSIAARLSGSTNPGLYRVSHERHPITLWAMHSRKNYEWLCELTAALFDEYERRYDNPNHRSLPTFEQCLREIKVIPRRQRTEHPHCVPPECLDLDIVQSYRNSYMTVKRCFVTWKNGPPPWWT